MLILTPKIEDEIVAASTAEGATIQAVCERFGCCNVTVYRVLARRGVKRPKRVRVADRPDEFVPPRQFIDLAGQRFGRLVPESIVGRDRHGFLLWQCRCDCGAVTRVTTGALRGASGKKGVRSCGCLKADTSRNLQRTHGRTGTPEHWAWNAARHRCKRNRRYVKAGITVCRRWAESFEAFFADMGARPSNKHSLDRIEGKKGYWCGKPECPECGPAGREPNCRWATQTTQSQNQSTTRWIEFNGERLCLSEWARRLNIASGTLKRRLDRWPVERALTEHRHEGGPGMRPEPFTWCSA